MPELQQYLQDFHHQASLSKEGYGVPVFLINCVFLLVYELHLMHNSIQVAEALPVEDNSMDAVIGTLVLCSVNNIDMALRGNT